MNTTLMAVTRSSEQGGMHGDKRGSERGDQRGGECGNERGGAQR